MVLLGSHRHQPSLSFQSACCSCHLPLVLSLSDCPQCLFHTFLPKPSPILSFSAEDPAYFAEQEKSAGSIPTSPSPVPTAPHMPGSTAPLTPSSLLLLQRRRFHGRPARRSPTTSVLDPVLWSQEPPSHHPQGPPIFTNYHQSLPQAQLHFLPPSCLISPDKPRFWKELAVLTLSVSAPPTSSSAPLQSGFLPHHSAKTALLIAKCRERFLVLKNTSPPFGYFIVSTSQASPTPTGLASLVTTKSSSLSHPPLPSLKPWIPYGLAQGVLF